MSPAGEFLNRCLHLGVDVTCKGNVVTLRAHSSLQPVTDQLAEELKPVLVDEVIALLTHFKFAMSPPSLRGLH